MKTLDELPTYFHLKPGDELPVLEMERAFKAVVVVESEVTPEWRAKVSDWLVQSGCLYMMAWGQNCSAWDDSVDHATLEIFNYGAIPDDDFVMTTWHDNEPMEEVFWFSQFCAWHPSVELVRTYILHIALESRESELLKAFQESRSRQ